MNFEMFKSLSLGFSGILDMFERWKYSLQCVSDITLIIMRVFHEQSYSSTNGVEDKDTCMNQKMYIKARGNAGWEVVVVNILEYWRKLLFGV